MRELQSRWTTRHSGWPSFDLHEENGELVLHADVRGFDDEGVQISLDGGHLVVQSKGESERDATGIRGDPPPSPLLGDVRCRSAPARGVKDQVARIGRHQ